MVVVLVILASIGIWFALGATDFAINMTIWWVCFGILEGANYLISGKTITQKFRKWSETQPRWKVWAITGTIVLVSAYFMMHLAVGW